MTERAVQVWEPVQKVIKHYSSLAPSKRPKDNSSYDTLVANKNDTLMKVKLQLFKDIAHKSNLYLTAFQTDAPMVPFLAQALEEILRYLMGSFISPSTLQTADTRLQLV